MFFLLRCLCVCLGVVQESLGAAQLTHADEQDIAEMLRSMPLPVPQGGTGVDKEVPRRIWAPSKDDVVVTLIKTGPGGSTSTTEQMSLKDVQDLIPTNFRVSGGSVNAALPDSNDVAMHDIIDELVRALDVSVASGLMPIAHQVAKPPVHPCDPLLTQLCPGVQRQKTQQSIHCLAVNKEQVTPECEITIKNSLPYLCHNELDKYCEASSFDVSPAVCLRELYDNHPEKVDRQCIESMEVTHRMLEKLNDPNTKIIISHRDDAGKLEDHDEMLTIAGRHGATLEQVREHAAVVKRGLGWLLLFLLVVAFASGWTNRSVLLNHFFQSAVGHFRTKSNPTASYGDGCGGDDKGVAMTQAPDPTATHGGSNSLHEYNKERALDRLL